MIARLALGIVALATAASAAHGQTWRTLDAAGAALDSSPVAVHLEYTRGGLQARPAERDAVLYDLHLRYDASRARPLLTFDSATRSLTIGAQARDDMRAGGEGRASGDAVVQLGRSSPLNVAVRLDVATANLDFGGLPLRSLAVDAAASEVRVRFGTANATQMETLDFDISAAAVTASGLGNANAGRMSVAARGGSAELDLGGAWARDMELEIDVTLGAVTIHVPSDVGIELRTTRRMVAQVDAGALRQTGDRHVSANAATATRKLRINADLIVGKLRVIHAAR